VSPSAHTRSITRARCHSLGFVSRLRDAPHQARALKSQGRRTAWLRVARFLRAFSSTQKRAELGFMISDELQLRARFLTAMGLSAMGVSLSCSSPPRIANDPKDVKVLPADALQRTELGPSAWSVEYTKEEPDNSGLPSCPSGQFCVASTREGAEGNAEAPFSDCAAKVPYPKRSDPNRAPGGPAWVGGPDINDVTTSYMINFLPNWTKHERMAKDPHACCYEWVEPCPGGRPLRDESGEVVVAPIVSKRGDGVATTDRERARKWARAAQYEHASVASFARFSLELMALGAPASLVRRAHEAALDEIAHAELAFALASSFGGRGVGPGCLPLDGCTTGEVSPSSVALATLRDGCISETIAALDAVANAPEAATEAEREAIERIAEDEQRHAELAFATLAWLVEAHGEPVRSALTDAIDALEESSAVGSVEARIVVPCVRALLASPCVRGLA
jgi:hypothetical protein